MAEGKVGLRVPTLLRTKSQIVGTVNSNDIRFLLSEWARVARMSSPSTSITCHVRVHNLVRLLVRRLQPFHEEIHLGVEHIDTVNMVSSPSRLLPISFPTLVGSNLLHQRLRSSDVEREKRTT